MPTSSEAVNGIFAPVLVPDQTYKRSEYEDSVPRSIKNDVDELPEISTVVNRTSKLRRIKNLLIIGCMLIGITTAGVLPATIVSEIINKVTVTTTATTTVNNNSTLASSSTSISTNTTSSNSSTTTVCPTNICTYSTWYTLISSGYYGIEHVDLNCSQSLSNLTAFIYVQRTVNASYANQYNNFWNGTANQTYISTGSRIAFSWSSFPNRTIVATGYPYFMEAQFQLFGINQTVANDTYSIFAQSACNGQIITQSGHF